jgi:heptosyltransferase I
MNVPAAPESICILRLSALGDVTHVVPMVRTLRDAWPGVPITWIIGRLEAKLVGDLPDVEFVVFDKKEGYGAFRALRRALRGRRFDALLQCQLALRAGLASTLVRARRRIGYDRVRAREGHGLFVGERIPYRPGQHVLDALGSFVEPLGLKQTRVRWDLPIPDEAHAFAAEHLPGDRPTLIVSPCSSHALRNWRPERYAAVADHAVRRHGLRVALCGGRSTIERATGDAILAAMREPALDLIGKDTLKQFLALSARAFAVLTPDAGPMHLANAVGAPVLGLHAATDSRRSGPYTSCEWTVDRYAEAARKFKRCEPDALRWGTRIEYPGVMDLIEVDDVIERLDALVKKGRAGSGRGAASGDASR